MGWSGTKNGELLKRMQDHGFQFLITMDKSLQFQLPIDRYEIRLIVLKAVHNKLKILRPLMPKVLDYVAREDFVKVKEIS